MTRPTRSPAIRSAAVRSAPKSNNASPEDEIIWSWGGPLDGDATPGPPWRVPHQAKITSVTLTAGVAGSNPAKFGLYLNDNLMEEFTLGTGERVHYFQFVRIITQGDLLHVQQDASVWSATCVNIGIAVRYVRTFQPTLGS